jgi:hypothetical protein
MSDAEPSPLMQALSIQAQTCRSMGSPFSAALLDAAAEAFPNGGPLAQLFGPWQDADVLTVFKDAAQLRFLGALHDLALTGEEPGLTAAYPAPGRPGDAATAWQAVVAGLPGRHARLSAFMAHEPQTNETRRSICLLGGFLTIAQDTGLPMRCFEIGASAGLNQLWDRYRYDLGSAGAWGGAGAAVAMDTEWRGGPPPLNAAVRVASRAACDRKPVDLTDPAARRRLKAYIWPDQFDRLARLDAAIGEALAARTLVDAADAVDWTRAHVAPEDGAASVLFHSVFWQYMPPQSQADLAGAIAEIGERAAATSPFAWLRMEPSPGSMAIMEIRLTLWPTGEDRLLATCHPHGAWVEWLG